MLYIKRKIGQAIFVNGVKITVVDTRNNIIKLGFDYQPEDIILREEVYKDIADVNQSASEFGIDMINDFLKKDEK